MPGIDNQDKKSKLVALLLNPQFQEKVVEFRSKWGIPPLGFPQINEEYKDWVLGHIEYAAPIRHDFEMIAKRCRSLYSVTDPIFSSLLSLYFLFNRFPDSYPNDLHLPILPKIRNSGVLGYIDLVLPLPIFFNYTIVQETIQSSEGLILGVIKNFEDSIKALTDANIKSVSSDEINNSFLLAPPGNPHDIISKTQEYLELLVDYGRALLRNSVSNIKTPDVKDYQDKNVHIDSTIQRIGSVLANRQLYPIVELFWKNITDETEQINKEKGWKLNRGISLANTGVYQIVQGKVDDGLFNLYRALSEDKEILEKLNDPNSNPELNIVSTILFTQFEQPLLDWLYNEILIRNSNLVDVIPECKDINNFVASLEPGVRLLLFNTLWGIRQGWIHNEILSNFIDRGRLISSLGNLCLWVESMMRSKDPKFKKLYNGFSFLKFSPPSGFSLLSETLDELQEKIADISQIGNKDQQNALVLILIRNYSSHNFESREHDFFSNYDKYLASIFFTTLLIAKNGKL